MSNHKNSTEVRSQQINLRVTPIVDQALKEKAKTTGLSVNSIICLCLDLQLDNVQGKGKAKQ
jgi:predicted HicB family RNase H-like nuclease